MKKILTTVCFGVLFLQLNAQNLHKQVIASTGNSASAGGFQLEQTVGEPMVTTHTQGGFILCQGFQQIDGINTVSVEELDNYSFSYYPNPIVNTLKVELQDQEPEVGVMVFDQSGRMMFQDEKQNTQHLELDFSAYSFGVYFVQLNVKNENIRFEVVKR